VESAPRKAFRAVHVRLHTFALLALQLYIRYLTGQLLRGLNLCRAEKSFANFSTQQNFLC
jgi:hypothetical protein